MAEEQQDWTARDAAAARHILNHPHFRQLCREKLPKLRREEYGNATAINTVALVREGYELFIQLLQDASIPPTKSLEDTEHIS